MAVPQIAAWKKDLFIYTGVHITVSTTSAESVHMSCVSAKVVEFMHDG